MPNHHFSISPMFSFLQMSLAAYRYLDSELVRYFISGSVVFASDFLLLAFLTEICEVPFLISNIFSVILGITVSYALCSLWVFKFRRYESRKVFEVVIFIFTCLAGIALNELFLWILVGKFALHYLMAKCCVTLIMFVSNYTMKKWIVFGFSGGSECNLFR